MSDPTGAQKREPRQEGGRLRQVAAKAGISDPYLFRHFASKAALYDAAVRQPLIGLVERFEEEIAAISSGGPITVARLLLLLNRITLQFMLDAVPYIGAALFSESASGNDLYTTEVYPRIAEPIVDLLRRVRGWPPPTLSLEMVANSLWGVNYGVALDALHTGLDIDLDKTTERITRLYLLGIPAFHSRVQAAGAP
jgi:TetR/AcrR family transcriptional regulator